MQQPSEYKEIQVTEVYFDITTFIWSIIFLCSGVLALVNSKGSLGPILFGLFICFIGLCMVIHLFSKRPRTIRLRKTDDEILEELIALEEIGKHLSKKVTPPETNINSIKKKLPNDYFVASTTKVIFDQRQISYMDKMDTLIDLLRKKHYNEIYYSDLLRCVEWEFKRLQILVRDDFKCLMCKRIGLSNHVHHTYYIQDRLPWEIDNSALKTLCETCHYAVHQQDDIPIKSIGSDGRLFELSSSSTGCRRCGDAGYLLQFSHVEGGICFACRQGAYRNSTFRVPLRKILQGDVPYDVNDLRKSYKVFIEAYV